MDISNFAAGTYRNQYQYKSFLPAHVNIEWQVSDSGLVNLLSEADIKLGELNAFSQLVPDVDFYIQMHVSLSGQQRLDFETHIVPVRFFR